MKEGRDDVDGSLRCLLRIVLYVLFLLRAELLDDILHALMQGLELFQQEIRLFL